MGATDKDICDYLSISYTTYYRWVSEIPEFAEIIRNGRDVVNRKVENALLQRALGFNYVEEKQIIKNGEVIQKERTRKYSPPDVTAIAMWLNNRKPDDWKRSRDNYKYSEGGGDVQINIIKAETSKKHKKEDKNE
jgi:hypothetical protein